MMVDAAGEQRMARHFLLRTCVAALFAVGSAAVVNAQQSPNGSVAVAAGRIEAPVGHRQPRAQDLPRDVRQDEGGRTEEQIEFDKRLSICRGC
jgi:hypothetical protein